VDAEQIGQCRRAHAQLGHETDDISDFWCISRAR
jgi:hypothetical protein